MFTMIDREKPEILRTLIFGASRQGSIVLEIFRTQGIFVEGFLDDDVNKHGKVISGLPVIGDREWVKVNTDRPLAAIIAIGNNEVRTIVGNQFREHGVDLINAIHPSAVVMDGTTTGTGNLICAGAIIVTGTYLEDDIVVNTGVTIDHDSVLHSGVYVAPGVHTAGCVTIGRGAFIGTGTVIGPNVNIGDGCVVGAGSLVLSDLPAGVLAFGSPAKSVKQIKEPVNWSKLLARL